MREEPIRPPRPPEPMSASAEALYGHRAAVRAGLSIDATHATETVRNLVSTARYAAVPVPPALDEAIVVLARYAESVHALIERDRAEITRRGISAAEHQRAVERTRINVALAVGKHATGQER
jgi:hypothetical protein